MKPWLSALAAIALLGGAASAADTPSPAPAAPDPAAARAATIRLPAAHGARLAVTSPAFRNDGDIPFENTQYRGNVFPGLTWSPGPAATKAYALIVQDMDFLYRGTPILHGSMFNIPARVTILTPGMIEPPAGASAGPNYKGAAPQPILGPRTPPGPKHHYHFQVFALDAPLPASAGAGYEALIAAMQGHVLASGEIVGLGQVDPTSPPRTPPPAAPK